MSEEFTVLGVLGQANSGKDLVADWFVEKGFVKLSFADPMKRFVLRAFGTSPTALWGPSSERNKEFEVDSDYWFSTLTKFDGAMGELIYEVLQTGEQVQGYLKLHDWLNWLRTTYTEKLSARIILQTLGTEWGRAVNQDMWVRYAHQMVDKIKHGSMYDQLAGLVLSHTSDKYKGVIIPDHRFMNEIDYTRSKGGYVMKIRRLSAKSGATVGISGHQSEAEQSSIPETAFDLIVEFEEGVDKVHKKLEGIYEEQQWSTLRRPRL